MPGHSPHHLTSVESIITDIFTRHGLLALTDVEQPMMSGGPLGLALDPDMIAEIKSKSEWDGMPSPDKLIAVLLGLVSRPKKAPPAVTTRLVGVVPATHRTVILVAHSFFPVATADTADLRKIGRWAISVRDEGGVPVSFAGDILDHEIQNGALELITSVCAKWKKDLGLDSLMGGGRQEMLIGGGMEGLGPYVDGIDRPVDHRRLPGRPDQPRNEFPPLSDEKTTAEYIAEYGDTLGPVGKELLDTMERLLPGMTMQTRFAAVVDLARAMNIKPPEHDG